LRREHDSVELIVSDNGKGFVETRFADSVDDGQELPRRGFGLMGIRERARLFHAAPTLHSAPGEGTTITIRFARPPAHTESPVETKSDGNEQ
jgi:signal transduction histidine kinase